MRAALRALAALALAGAVTADESETRDEERAAWAFRRGVAVVAPTPDSTGFAELALPPEVMAHARPDLRDLRLVADDGRELPYVLEARVGRETTTHWPGVLADARREAKQSSAWTVDLGQPRAFDRVVFTIPGSGFAKRARLEVSADGRSWSVVVPDAGVFDRPWVPPIHHTTLALPSRITARFVRLTLDDRRSRPVDVTAAVVALVTRREGEAWQLPAPLTALPGRPGVSRYRLEAPAGLSFDELRLESDDPAFSRRVSLLEAVERNGRREETPLGSDALYRVRLPEEDLAAEAVTLRVARGEGGERILEVEDGDSPPLFRPRAEISGPVQRLVFPASSPATLYYGNDATRAPFYDLALLRERLGASGSLTATALGPEARNPGFRRPAPVPFAALRGASLAAGDWSRARPVEITGREDLYTLTLDPLDLAVLRPDLGDLRIADDAGRQIPYLLEAEAAEVGVELAAARDDGGGRRAERSTSRYRLTPAGVPPGREWELPLRALELELEPAFFSRGARVLAPARNLRERERVAFAGTLARAAGAGSQVRVGLDGSRESVLFLEIDEGDNEPLSLKRVAGLVRVPRVVFKAAAGRYRLLLGNRAASPPRYDLASLRREVLSYSAVPVRAGAAGDNAGRGRAWGRLGEAPPALLLWTALGGAVVALLLLTARILRQPQP